MKTSPIQKIVAKSNHTIPKYWAINKKSDTEAELMMYGEIDDSNYWGDENTITPKMIDDELKALGEDINTIRIRLNSPGGSVYAGIAIRAILKNHKAKKILHIEGVAASIATVIMTGADEVIAEPGSMVMIHKSRTVAFYQTADEMRKTAEQMDKIDASMASFYAGKTGKTSEEIMEILSQGDTWFTDQEALDFGLVDSINGKAAKVAAYMKNDTVAVINNVEMDFSRFEKAPVLPVAKAIEPEPETEPQPQAKQNEGEKEIMNMEELKSKHPDIYAQVIKEGVKQERDRIVALNTIGSEFPGSTEIINKAIAENQGEGWAYKEIAMMQKVAVATATATIQTDVTASGVNEVAVSGAESIKDNAGVKAKDEAEKDASQKMVDAVKAALKKNQK